MGLLEDVFDDAAPEAAPAAPVAVDVAEAPREPPPPVVLDLDPLSALTRAIERVERDLEALPPNAVVARRQAYETVGRLAGRMEAILSKRPRPPSADEVQERIRGAMDSCVGWLLRHTRERAARLKTDRAALFEGLDIAPGLAAELGRRVDAMLGGKP